MLLPDQPGPIPHLLIMAGKEGTIYLIDRDNMGKFSPDFDSVVQEVPNAILGWGSYGTPAYFSTGAPDQRWVYFAGQRDVLRAFQLFDDGTLSTSSTSQSGDEFAAPHGATPSLSANGNTNGIVWAISPGIPAVLYAYDATNVAINLYDSSQAGRRDQLDPGVKFSVPTIADGKVFVGTVDTLSVFGLLPGGGAAKIRSRKPVTLLPHGWSSGEDGRGISGGGNAESSHSVPESFLRALCVLCGEGQEANSPQRTQRAQRRIPDFGLISDLDFGLARAVSPDYLIVNHR